VGDDRSQAVISLTARRAVASQSASRPGTPRRTGVEP
jgi:hypothetical protein